MKQLSFKLGTRVLLLTLLVLIGFKQAAAQICPTASISGNTSFCAGGNSVLNSKGTGGGSVTATSAGYGYSFFLKNDGTVWATCDNGTNKFGDATNTNESTPVQVSNISGITSIADTK